jgi:hypothetical protein
MTRDNFDMSAALNSVKNGKSVVRRSADINERMYMSILTDPYLLSAVTAESTANLEEATHHDLAWHCSQPLHPKKLDRLGLATKRFEEGTEMCKKMQGCCIRDGEGARG